MRSTSAPECLSGFEMGVAVTHLIAKPGVSSPPGEPILEACDASASMCQQVDREVDRNLKGRQERPRPWVGHVVGPVEAAWQEVVGVTELDSIVDLVADRLARTRTSFRCKRARIRLDEFATVLARAECPLGKIERHQLACFAQIPWVPTGLHAHEVPHVSPEVHHRFGVRGGRSVAEFVHAQPCAEPTRQQRDGGFGLVDRFTPCGQVPLRVAGDPMPEKDVHDANPHGGGAARRSGSGAAGFGYVDPEARGLHEAVEGGVARVLTGHAERLQYRVFGVREQGGDTEEAENGRAAPPEEKGATFDEIVMDPWRIYFEFLEQSQHRRRRVGNGLDSLCESLVQHGPAVGRVAFDVGVLYEGLSDRVCVVVAMCEVEDVVGRRQCASSPEEFEAATFSLTGASTALIQERLEIGRDLIDLSLRNIVDSHGCVPFVLSFASKNSTAPLCSSVMTSRPNSVSHVSISPACGAFPNTPARRSIAINASLRGPRPLTHDVPRTVPRGLSARE